MVSLTNARQRDLNHPWLCVALLGLLALYTVAADAKRKPPQVDVNSIKPGHGVVIGSVLVTWPNKPSLMKLIPKNKFIEIRRLNPAKEHKFASGRPIRLKADLNKEEYFLLELETGRYQFTCLYDADIMFRQPVWDCYPIDTHFEVMDGRVNYLGHLSLVMPSKMRELVSHQLLITVEDRRQEAVTALATQYGSGIGKATTILAHAPDRPDTIELNFTFFPRLVDNFNHPEMIHFEEKPGVYTLTRFVAQGRNAVDWDIAFEVMESPREIEPLTVAEWLVQFRAQGDGTCPGGEWEVLTQTDSEISFEWRTEDCPPHVAQHAMYRILYGSQNVFTLICTQKGGFDAQTRDECQTTLGATLFAKP